MERSSSASRGSSRVIYMSKPPTTTPSEDLFPTTKKSAKPAVLEPIFSMDISTSSAPICFTPMDTTSKEVAAAALPQLLRGGVGYGIPQEQPQIKPYLLPFLKPVTAPSNITFRRVDPMNGGTSGGGRVTQRGSGGGGTSSSLMTQGVKRTIIKIGRGNGNQSRNRGPRRRDNHWGKDATKEELDAELDKWNKERGRKSLEALDAELDKYQAITVTKKQEGGDTASSDDAMQE